MSFAIPNVLTLQKRCTQEIKTVSNQQVMKKNFLMKYYKVIN